MTAATLLVAGLGYTGAAAAAAARAAGFAVIATARDPAAKTPPDGVALIPFAQAAGALGTATHLLVTAAPTADGDPLLALCAEAIASAPALRWIGYASTTGVYGDRQGGSVDESAAPAPGSPRTRRRVAAERQWAAMANEGRAVDIMRLAGIYGPGRSAFDDLRAGTARRIDKPAHKFSRIHVDDIAGATMAAIATATRGVRILNFADDEPAPSAEIIARAASLLGIAPPPLIPFDEARRGMSPMALSFWSENRIVLSRATQQTLRRPWRLPSYREGLAAILAAEGVSPA